MATDPLAEELLKRYSDLKEKRRTTYDDTWQEAANYFLPQEGQITVIRPAGSTYEWTDQLFDTTGIGAAMTFMAGDYNWTTPPQQQWAAYTWPAELGEPDDEAMAWLGKATDDVMATLARSNFYSTRAMSALGLGVFGTDFMLFEEDEKDLGEFNFRHVRISTYAAEEDYKGVVDTTMREFKMTYRQIKQRFKMPKDTIPEEMEKAAGDGPTKTAKKFTIVHVVMPREDSKKLGKRRDSGSKPIASIYISLEYRKVIRVSGYDEQPALVPRFTKWDDEDAYGFGPSYIALPDAREVNYMAEFMDGAAEKLVDPRILTPSNLEGDVGLRAGEETVFDEDKPAAVPREWASAAEYKLGMEIMEQKRQAIREAFFVPAFKLLNSEPLLDKKMTMYEISQRQAEQLQGYTPALARRVPEFINPLMRRALAIRVRAGKLGAIPQSLYKKLGGRKAVVMPDVEVTSKISDSLKALKNAGIHQTMEFIAPIAEAHPELRLYDNFKMDDLVVGEARNNAIPAELIRPKKGADSVAQLRQVAKAQADAARNAQTAEMLGKAGAGLGRSPQFLQDQAEQTLTGKKGKRAA